MTVASAVSRITVAGNSSATSFAFPFKITSSSHLVVTKTTSAGITSTLTLGTHYSVTGVGSESGGSITYPLSGTALPTGDTITMRRVVPLTQTTDLTNQGAFYAEVHESEFDHLTYITQQLSDELTALDAIVDGLIGDVPGALRAYSFSGDGSTVLFTLGLTITGGVRSILVAIDGVLQAIDTYAVSGTSLVFSEAPPYGSVIDVRAIGEAYAATVTDTSLVTATGSTTPRYLSDRFADVANVRDFGAAGNGVTDDSAAFTAALAAATAVFVPPGTYVVTNVTVGAGKTLYGAGDASILKLKASSTNPALWLTGAYPTVRTLMIDGNVANQTSGASIGLVRITSGYGAVLEGVTLNGAKKSGAYVSYTTDAANSTTTRIRGCTVRSALVDGVTIRSSSNVTVEDNVILSCTGSGVGDAGPDTDKCSGIRIADNEISLCSIGVYLAAQIVTSRLDPTQPYTIGAAIAGNEVFSCTGYGILVAGKDVRITNNTVRDIGSPATLSNYSNQGIVCQSRDTLIDGNIITSIGGCGIDLGNCEDFVCSNNKIRDVNCYGIEVNSSRRGTVSGNNIRNAWLTTDATARGQTRAGIVVSKDAGSVLNMVTAVDVVVTGNRITHSADIEYAIAVKGGATDTVNIMLALNPVVGVGTVAPILNNSSTCFAALNGLAASGAGNAGVTGNLDVSGSLIAGAAGTNHYLLGTFNVAGQLVVLNDGTIRLRRLAKVNLPAASATTQGCIAYMTDAVGDKRLVICDGSVWRYMDGTAT